MGRVFSLVVVLAIVGAGAYIFMRQAQSVTPAGAGNPGATVDITGVKSDLVNIARAERLHQAQRGSYASIDDLLSSGDLSMGHTSRGPYHYSASFNDSGFQITASYSGPENSGMPRSISIDQSMTITQE